MTSLEETLQKQVIQLTEERDQWRLKCERSREAYDHLLDQVKELQRHRFGVRSERYHDPENPQLSFEDELNDKSEPTSDGDVAFDEAVTDIKAYKRRKKANKAFANHLPRKEVTIEVPEHDKHCSCGCRKQVIRHERHERLHYQPPVFEVIVELREVVACFKGCSGQLVTAEKPKHILPKARFTESVLAHIIISKLEDRQPYYHLEKKFEKRSGITLTRENMARSAIKCAEPLQPLFNLMKDQLLDYDLGALDATTLQVLNEPGRKATTKSYVYCMRGGPPDKPVILYDYNAHLHKLYVNDWFAGFKGTLNCDGDPFFDLLFSSDDVQPSFCSAHARRKFEAITHRTPGDGLAKHAMRFYKKLYQVETKAKKDDMNPEQRLALRQQWSAGIMEEFKAWLDEVCPTIPPKSSLGKAVRYCLKYWSGMNMFLQDGRIEIDNNLTEQEIKPFVIARKNFLFANSVSGAKALCLHFSLIRTAKLHNLDPFRYYEKILKQIPYCETVEDYEALLPWNIDIPRVGEVQVAA